jgi:exopolysaccharide biosynthesis polyprenyl glycosylphosphotransferase
MVSFVRAIGLGKVFLAILDLIVLVGFAVFILLFRSRITTTYEFNTNEIIFFALSSIIAIQIFREFHLYKHKIFSTASDQFIILGKGMLTLGILQVVGIFLLKDTHLLDYSRTHILVFIFGGWIVLGFFRVGVFRSLYRKLNGNGTARRKVLGIGAGRAAQALATRTYENPELGLQIVGFIDDDPEKIGRQLLGRPIFGGMDRVEEIARQLDAEEIFIAINEIEYSSLLDIIERCRLTGLPVTVATDHFRIIHNKIGTSEFESIDSMTLRPRDLESASWQVKRLIDVVGSVLLLLILSPLLIVIALAIKLTSEGPVFYRSQVVGRKGKLFTWFKFRTMVVHRDEAIHREHLRKIITQNGSTEKITNDPRITAVGRILRKYSLDELPQLFNVFRGEMSLIGPRPCLQYEYEHFHDWHKQRFSITPGMTGLWQVLGRNKDDVTFNDSIILDLYYIQNYSLWLDMKILVKTIPTVILGRGGA